MKAYRFLTEAEDEFHEAVAYFDTQSTGLGDRFIDEVERCVHRIVELPASGVPVSAHVRRVVLQIFPYSLLYVVEPSGILILAVAPHRRRPNYWRKRVGAKREPTEK